MTNEIEQFLKQRGINPNMVVERNGGTQMLKNLIKEFHEIDRNQTINDMIDLLKIQKVKYSFKKLMDNAKGN